MTGSRSMALSTTSTFLVAMFTTPGVTARTMGATDNFSAGGMVPATVVPVATDTAIAVAINVFICMNQIPASFKRSCDGQADKLPLEIPHGSLRLSRFGQSRVLRALVVVFAINASEGLQRLHILLCLNSKIVATHLELVAGSRGCARRGRVIAVERSARPDLSTDTGIEGGPICRVGNRRQSHPFGQTGVLHVSAWQFLGRPGWPCLRTGSSLQIGGGERLFRTTDVAGGQHHECGCKRTSQLICELLLPDHGFGPSAPFKCRIRQVVHPAPRNTYQLQGAIKAAYGSYGLRASSTGTPSDSVGASRA